MAVSRKEGNIKKKNNGSPKKDFNLKREILGLVVVAIGVLLFLAIYSYNKADPVGKILDYNSYEVSNYLGIAGSTIAAPLFQWGFGYPSLIFPLLLILGGVFYLLRFPLKKLLYPGILGLLWAWLFSIAIALPAAVKSLGHTLNYFPSGFLGGFTADLMIRIFGEFAAVFLLVVFFLILSILSFRIRFSQIPYFIIQGLKKFFHVLGWVIGGILALPSKLSQVVQGRKKEKIRLRYGGSEKEEVLKKTVPEKIDTPVEEPESAELKDVEIIKPEIPEAGIYPEEFSDLPSENEPEADLNEQPANTEEKIPPEAAPGKIPAKDLEIEEVVHEEELDYDALVRDSLSKYQFPSVELLNIDLDESKITREELLANANLLEKTLANFGVRATVKKVVEGPVITLYAVRPAEGVKINQIVSLTDDLALALRAKGIRMIAPIPGEAAIGVEIPNRNPSIVYFSSVVKSEKFINNEGKLVLGMGKTISGEVYCADLTQMPHLLIAGSTGSGKSVGINTIIGSILYRVPPSDVKFVLIDPKKLELTLYAKLKDHYLAICPELDEIVITHPQNAIMILRSVVNEMEERYDKLAHLGVRDITSYNIKIDHYREKGETSENYRRLPYIVVVIDELADLILSASREVEEPITRLAQMARAVGIHLIVATQRPSVDILTGLIKANFPTRIAYQVATRPDSKVILDMYGSEKLIGNGDMLFLPPGTGKPIRLQNPLITTEEVERIIKHVRKQPKFPPYHLKLIRSRSKDGPGSAKAFEYDELFEQAKEIVIRHQQGSISLLQRKLKIGYARAARLVDELEEAGVVGPGQGSKAREVLISAYGND